MTEEIQVTIIGAGVIGCAIAAEISRDFNGEILVIEKNDRITGENQSSRNSGVIHAGIYYPMDFGPLKSSLCVKGNSMLYDFCKRHGVPHKKTGKLVLATNNLEEEYLADVMRIAKENGVPGARLIDIREIKKLEPNVDALSALYVPTSGIIEPTLFVKKLHGIAEEQGVIFLTGNKLTEIKPDNNGKFFIKIRSRSSEEVFKTKFLINCAGLFSDEIAKMIDPLSPYEIDPVKGESAKFYCRKRENIIVKGTNIYPVPFGYYPDGERADVPFNRFVELFRQHKVIKSVGAHLTPVFDLKEGRYETGTTITIGPAYSKPQNKEDYAPTRNAGYFHKMVKPFFPNLRIEDITLHQTGIRAKLKGYYDFIIEKSRMHPHAINLIGIDSPGLTSSLAIAEYVNKMLKDL